MKSDAELRREKRDFQRGVLELILYASITEKDCELPTTREFILSELVSAASEYITGEEIDGLGYERTARLDYPKFERTVLGFWKKITEDFKNKIHPLLLESIIELITPVWSSNAWGDGANDTELYDHFTKDFNPICGPRVEKVFSLQLETIRRVERKVLPGLSESVAEECKRIGQIMRKYINRDLEYIRKRYLE